MADRHIICVSQHELKLCWRNETEITNATILKTTHGKVSPIIWPSSLAAAQSSQMRCLKLSCQHLKTHPEPAVVQF